MMLTHIEIDIQDEQEANRVLTLLDREKISYRVERRPIITEEGRTDVKPLSPENQ